MKKLLLAMLLSTSALASDYTTYDSKTNTLNIPFIDYYGTGFKDVVIDVGSCYNVLEYKNEPNSIATAKRSFTNFITNFVGLSAGDIFKFNNGLYWIVDESEKSSIEYLEYSPMVSVYQLYTDSFVLKYKTKTLKVKPFLFQNVDYTTIERYIGIKSTVFEAEGKLYQSDKILHYTTGSSVQIFDNKYLFAEGRTYLVNQIN